MKSKGGRAKKASYDTVVMRIPKPILPELEKLLEKFYDSIPQDKLVTSNSGKTIPLTSKQKLEKLVTGKESIDLEKLNLPTVTYNRLKRLQVNKVGDIPGVAHKKLGLGVSAWETVRKALEQIQ